MYKAESPINTYTIRARTGIVPKIASTKSKLNKPTSPQFIPPINTKTNDTQSSVVLIILFTSLF